MRSTSAQCLPRPLWGKGSALADAVRTAQGANLTHPTDPPNAVRCPTGMAPPRHTGPPLRGRGMEERCFLDVFCGGVCALGYLCCAAQPALDARCASLRPWELGSPQWRWAAGRASPFFQRCAPRGGMPSTQTFLCFAVAKNSSRFSWFR